MKLKKSIIVVSLLSSIVFLVGCNSRTEQVNKPMEIEEVERLPEDQKDTELDKALAEIRKFRKDNVKSENGSSSSRSFNGGKVPGNIPNPNEYTIAEYETIYTVIGDYIKNVLKIPKRDNYGHDAAQCLDPRINKLFEDEDRGILSEYDIENIFIAEYQTKEEGVYSYLFLARDSKNSPWKIVYDGNSYKNN